MTARTLQDIQQEDQDEADAINEAAERMWEYENLCRAEMGFSEYDPEAQRDLDLHDYLHPDGYN